MNQPAESPDELFMQQAIELAAKGQGRVEPNPMVGCVLARDGEIIGEGFHKQHGGPHAEIEALRSLGSVSATGATAYVSLEPCCHHGKTPPCTDSLIASGVKRVVLAMKDPFPKVSGGGIEQLRRAGIEVVCDVLRDQAAELNAPYLKLVNTGKPWVIAKWAMSVDGKIATHTGESQWITNAESRVDVHRTRSRVDGILTGMGTVRSDNPMLTARLPTEIGMPHRIAQRIILCSSSVPDASTQLMESARSIPVQIIAGAKIRDEDLRASKDLGATCTQVREFSSSDLITAALRELGKQGMTNILLEAGGNLLGGFADAGEIDEYHVYIGPIRLGNQHAPGPLGGVGIDKIRDAPRLQLHRTDCFGEDIKIVYRKSAESNKR